MRVISPEHDVDLYLSNSYGVDSEGNIVRGNLLKRDKVTYEELKDKITLMVNKLYELYEKIYGQYEEKRESHLRFSLYILFLF